MIGQCSDLIDTTSNLRSRSPAQASMEGAKADFVCEAMLWIISAARCNSLLAVVSVDSRFDRSTSGADSADGEASCFRCDAMRLKDLRTRHITHISMLLPRTVEDR